MQTVATIIVNATITKPEALDAIAAALGCAVQDAGTARPFVPLPHGGRVVVDIPKFGEAPPLAIDVSDPRGATESRLAAQALLDRLTASTGWHIHHLHG
ncbi:hypothetical protein E3T55_04640 [Cryobacterium frigoriphilum]|uniref:Uncharacterized protein n=1 Tax=Cryobacterium frigoriphilum TaxID=1259150 RepID=A0A4R9A8M4_9MICO|nr:hypothetical protein [Cryobacterium frigoriphilum]TFD53981.1 hypothetical protein E3T55_04640 [Cryobacterium frigoriphilum]